MSIHFHRPRGLARYASTGLLVLSFAALAPAQDPFNLDAQPAPPADDAAAPAAPAAIDETAIDNPVARAIVESDPATPAELTRAAQQLLDLGYPELSRKYLTQLLAAAQQPEVLADLHEQFGSAVFLRLGQDERIAPEGARFGQAVLRAGRQAASDPARIQRLIERLGDADQAARRAARVDLRSAGSAAVAPLIQVLADPERAAMHSAARDTLYDLNEVAAGPLIGVLSSPDDALRRQAMEVLGRLRTRRAVLFLVTPCASPDVDDDVRRSACLALERILGAVPSPDEARVFLHRQTLAHLGGKSDFGAEGDEPVELWVWDPQRQTVVSRRVRADDASLLTAGRIAWDLWRLEPENPKIRRLYVAATLAAAKVNYGLDRRLPVDADPLLRQLMGEGYAGIAEALDWSLENGYREAAIGAAELLGHLGDPDALRSTDGRPTALSRALEHPDPYVRFAALEAVLAIDPRGPFAGSSRVPEAISFFIRSSAERGALVAHPRADTAATLAGLLSALGYDARIATTGRDLLQRAREFPDCELILLSEHLTGPDANETLQAIRLEHRTRKLPVAVLGDTERQDPTRHLLETDPLTLVYPPPQTPEIAGGLAQRLEQLRPRRVAGAEQRLARASSALDALARLAEDPRLYGFYDLLRAEDAVLDALSSPPLTEQAALVLGRLGTPRAQSALVDLASQNVRPVPHRRAAVTAFDTAVGRRGVLLTTEQVASQYERYNASASLDQESQRILGSVLDTLEQSVAKRRASDRRSVSKDSPDDADG